MYDGEDFAYMVDVSPRRFATYNCIVEVYEGKLLFYAGHDYIHGMLRSAGCDEKSR